jgi:hypothetical protein
VNAGKDTANSSRPARMNEPANTTSASKFRPEYSVSRQRQRRQRDVIDFVGKHGRRGQCCDERSQHDDEG